VTTADCLDDNTNPQHTELFQSDFQIPATVVRAVESTFIVPPTSRFDALGGPTLAMKPRTFRPTMRGLQLPALTPRLALLLFGGTLLVTVLVALVIPGGEPEPRFEPAVSLPSPAPVSLVDTAIPDVAAPVPHPPSPAVSPPPAAVVTPAPVPEPIAPTRVHESPVSAKAREPAGPKFGYVSLRADGVETARMLLDGSSIGYSPVVLLKVTTGRHKLRIIEQTPDGPGRMKTVEINVTPRHTSQEPLRLVIPI
jgi:hypothetical protein